MPINSSAECNSRLNARLVEVAKRNVAARANQHVEKREARRAWKQDAAQTIRWLREIEAKEAVPLMHAIAKAENVVGRPLVVRIDSSLVLCSRGFRVASPLLIPPPAGKPDFTTFRLKRRSLAFGAQLVDEGKRIKERVKASLKDPNIENQLLYQGLDEWSTAGKICWYGAMLSTGLLPWWIVVYYVHCAAFRRAFIPVQSQMSGDDVG